MRQALEEAGGGGLVSYEDFTRIALYHPGHGYYQTDRKRVGTDPGTDFYTNSALAPALPELLLEAVSGLLEGRPTRCFSLVEVGPEPGPALLEGIGGSFSSFQTRRLGETRPIPRRSVVFANEWLDAQPFRRFVFLEAWKECGVRVGPEGWLVEGLRDDPEPPVRRWMESLPPAPGPGYRLDYSIAAEEALSHLLTEGWEGLFLTIDYGKTWSELLESSPEGTARGYYRHRMSPLLAHPGSQDLTCHLCWDRLERVAEDAGWQVDPAQRQESFLLQRAPRAVARLAADPKLRRSLQALLHPAHMGERFQVFSARKHLPEG